MKDFFTLFPMLLFQNFMMTLSFRFIADKNISFAVGIDAAFFTVNFWISRTIAQKSNLSPWKQYAGYILGGVFGVTGAMLLTR